MSLAVTNQMVVLSHVPSLCSLGSFSLWSTVQFASLQFQLEFVKDMSSHGTWWMSPASGLFPCPNRASMFPSTVHPLCLTVAQCVAMSSASVFALSDEMMFP